MTICVHWSQLLSCKLNYIASRFIMCHQKEDTGVTCLFIHVYGIEMINETKIRLFFPLNSQNQVSEVFQLLLLLKYTV
jgi:hypothetical protein